MPLTPVRLVALVLVVGSFSQSSAVAEQYSGAADNTLRIGVTVDPTCTIAVTPGEWTADKAVDLACRNLPASHPQPQVMPQEQVGINRVDGSPSRPTVVINF